MLQLQRVGVSRLRPRDQEGERDDRLGVCTRRSHTRISNRYTLPPLSVHTRVFVRAHEENGGEWTRERDRDERNLTKTSTLPPCLPREHPKMRTICACYWHTYTYTDAGFSRTCTAHEMHEGRSMHVKMDRRSFAWNRRIDGKLEYIDQRRTFDGRNIRMPTVKSSVVGVACKPRFNTSTPGISKTCVTAGKKKKKEKNGRSRWNDLIYIDSNELQSPTVCNWWRPIIPIMPSSIDAVTARSVVSSPHHPRNAGKPL